jgi:hypothetical protein
MGIRGPESVAAPALSLASIHRDVQS